MVRMRSCLSMCELVCTFVGSQHPCAHACVQDLAFTEIKKSLLYVHNLFDVHTHACVHACVHAYIQKKDPRIFPSPRYTDARPGSWTKSRLPTPSLGSSAATSERARGGEGEGEGGREGDRKRERESERERERAREILVLLLLGLRDPVTPGLELVLRSPPFLRTTALLLLRLGKGDQGLNSFFFH